MSRSFRLPGGRTVTVASNGTGKGVRYELEPHVGDAIWLSPNDVKAMYVDAIEREYIPLDVLEVSPRTRVGDR